MKTNVAFTINMEKKDCRRTAAVAGMILLIYFHRFSVNQQWQPNVFLSLLKKKKSKYIGGGRRRSGGGRAQKQQLPALHIDLPVTLKDLCNGRTFRVKKVVWFGQASNHLLQLMHKKTVLCPKCRGTGSDDPDDV